MFTQEKLIERYGIDEGMYLFKTITKWHHEEEKKNRNKNLYEYDDSYRLAQKGHTVQEKEYRATISCCGKVDIELGPSPGGFIYLYGFNYGH